MRIRGRFPATRTADCSSWFVWSSRPRPEREVPVSGADRPRCTSRREFLLAGAAVVAAGVYDVTGLLQHKPEDTSTADDGPAAAQTSREITFPRTATCYLAQ